MSDPNLICEFCCNDGKIHLMSIWIRNVERKLCLECINRIPKDYEE
jgi:hypothetical protein